MRPDTRADTIQCLTEARERLVTWGWKQGMMGNRKKGFCLLGAIYDGRPAGLVHKREDAAFYELAKCIDMNVAQWNDLPGRTVEQVLDAIDRTIEMIRRGSTEED